jgi:intracellular sulfur oxidation DsrE/DsrF family protein
MRRYGQSGRGRRTVVAVLAAFLLVMAAGPAPAQSPTSEDKPFAEAFIVLQVGDEDEQRQSMALNVANNLIKHYGGPDMVDIEIVAYGPGISLLYADAPQAERVTSLVASGVRFVACMNTLDTIERTTGERPALHGAARPVQTGVAHLVERAGQGFTVIRP